MRIGITGHTNLSAESVPLVADACREVLAEFQPLVGVTCLARGADQIFARIVLELGGQLEVVIPAADYRDRKVSADNQEEFDALVALSADVRVLPFRESNRDAYMAASDYVLSSVDRLIAVWDGKPAGGTAGTGEVVDAARARGMPVTVVWPPGAART